MKTLHWSKNMLKSENSQNELEQAVQLLLEESSLKTKGDYAQEKAIKTFCESIRYLEGALMYQYNVHPKKLDYVELALNKERYFHDCRRVEDIIKSETQTKLLQFLAILCDRKVRDWKWEPKRLHNQKVQDVLSEKVQALLKGPAKDKNEIAKESLLEVYTDVVVHLENRLLYQRNLQPEQNIVLQNSQQKEKLYEEVEREVSTEISRQFRHFLTFL